MATVSESPSIGLASWVGAKSDHCARVKKKGTARGNTSYMDTIHSYESSCSFISLWIISNISINLRAAPNLAVVLSTNPSYRALSNSEYRFSEIYNHDVRHHEEWILHESEAPTSTHHAHK